MKDTSAFIILNVLIRACVYLVNSYVGGDKNNSAPNPVFPDNSAFVHTYLRDKRPLAPCFTQRKYTHLCPYLLSMADRRGSTSPKPFYDQTHLSAQRSTAATLVIDDVTFRMLQDAEQLYPGSNIAVAASNALAIHREVEVRRVISFVPPSS